MCHLYFFTRLYFMEYNKHIVIPENNKCLNSDMTLSDYFRVIGCCFIVVCYVVYSVRDFFLKDYVTHQKGSPICLSHIISGRCLENITQVMSYTNISIPGFNDPFFQQRQMQGGWNKNVVAYFYPSWVSVLDESIQE